MFMPLAAVSHLPLSEHCWNFTSFIQFILARPAEGGSPLVGMRCIMNESGTAQRMRRKKKKFNIFRSIRDLSGIITELPKGDECIKALSFGGFSSASFIALTASKTHINNLHVSTFRVGEKEIKLLEKLHKEGKLDNCTFVVFATNLESSNDKYRYMRIVDTVCKRNNWKMLTRQNHSKVLLFDTDAGKYVIETSSNLNENPKVEQFSFEKDAALYDFYMEYLFKGV